ncbi:Tetratricopeptide repeat-containing protein [Methylobacillus rhizosphaerae]|uniref:protein O-GlcNAc transferase n=1 Tax=Methylobacillus rhizosphaerae TaxID=551994 RepID=A0A238Z7H9_9PROT|nr:tetratricopeptide repeat protein [Methylobacillus rhizosphaerae]SNR79357.1 Tetratricopeptide repeat-containing protein [Methylobacillus rhizosphaerae]
MSHQPPTHTGSLFHAGQEAEARHDDTAALEHYTASLATEGHPLLTWLRIGHIFLRMRQYQQAAETMELALGMAPQEAAAMHGLAMAYFHLGRHEEARALIDHVVEVQPGHAAYALDRANIHAISTDNPIHQRALYEQWAQYLPSEMGHGPQVFANSPDPDRVLRIAYIIDDLDTLSHLLLPVLEHHDASHVRACVLCASHIQAQASSLHDISRLSADALHTLIRTLEIDLLVNLADFSRHAIPSVLARRAAPIQLNWLGMRSSTGLQTMDYCLTDAETDPAGHEHFYLEKLLRLHHLCSYNPPQHDTLAPVPPMLQANPPTLGSFNRAYRVTDQALLLWKRIMEARPDVQLLLHVEETDIDDAVNAMEPRLVQLGMPMERIIISPAVSTEELMTRGSIVDIALDSFPTSDIATTLHTLWMGLPIIAMDSTLAPHSVAILKHLGLTQWIASSAEEYIAKVLQLLDAPEQLQTYRSQLQQQLQQSPLMDHAGYCRKLESCYRQIWHTYLQQTE